ncbi:MAG: phage tail sheath family protein [Lachnospiraceae bacterium]|nr:phage tail sheath family protein [Lachnospiraceae bacterium]
MAEYLSPGVYVEEFDSGIKAMEGVGTSTAGFVGMAQKGPVKGLPVLITSMADYQRRFGGYLSERDYGNKRFLPYAVEQFFNNGGSTCYVMRVCPESGTNCAKGILTTGQDTGTENSQPLLTLKAADPGTWGNGIKASFTPVLKNRVQIESRSEESICNVKSAEGYQPGDWVCIQYVEEEKGPFYNRVKETAEGSITLEWVNQEKVENQEADSFLYLVEWNLIVTDETASEQYEGLSFNPQRNNFVEQTVKKSQLITAEVGSEELEKLKEDNILGLIENPKDPVIKVQFKDGNDGDIKPQEDPDAGIYIGKDGAPDARTGLAAFKTLSDVSIMAIPGIIDASVQSALVSHCEEMKNRFAILDMPFECKEVSQLQAFKEGVDSTYAAMYHPWLQCYDALANRKVFLPPSGSMAGIYARTDNSRGVHKAPANEIVRNCTGLSVNFNEAEQGKLNPKGINLIRSILGQGIRVWGARTCSSDGNWKYVNVRRLFIFLEESIKANTNWAVFEPNDEMLWSRVEGTIRVFLTTQWRNGALSGATADEAFFINIGKSTMTEDDILNGRLICVIGVAPVRPAEFVIFRITQKMESAQ